MDIATVLVIIATGLAAGFVNTIAGGGSLLSLPVLIFLGLPVVTANATNRVAIAVQNIFAVSGFRRKGFFDLQYSGLLAVFATFGAFFGAKIALNINAETFKRMLAAIMLVILLCIIFNPIQKMTHRAKLVGAKQRAIGAVVFFFVGVYGGFIQCGVGLLILAALTLVNNFDLVKANSIKAAVILVYTFAALAVFAWEGKVYWRYGLILAIGNGAGGWIGSHWAVAYGEKWLKRVLIVAISAMAAKLSGIL